jgi:hypothetical protein
MNDRVPGGSPPGMNALGAYFPVIVVVELPLLAVGIIKEDLGVV